MCRLAICGIANPAEGANDRCLSRAERLEIISLVAAVGMSECSAWINPMLERGGPDEDPMEQ